MIFGPRVWRTTVALTPAPSTRGVPIFILSPSPSMTMSLKIICSPSSADSLSTRMVSSLETRYCLPPVFTKAYMAIVLIKNSSAPRASGPARNAQIIIVITVAAVGVTDHSLIVQQRVFIPCRFANSPQRAEIYALRPCCQVSKRFCSGFTLWL